MLLSQDCQNARKIDAPFSQFIEYTLAFVGVPFALRYWPLMPTAILRLAVFQVKFNNPARIGGSKFNRIDARHVDVAGVEHQVNMVWIRQLHQSVDFFAVLQLRPKMRMDSEL